MVALEWEWVGAIYLRLQCRMVVGGMMAVAESDTVMHPLGLHEEVEHIMVVVETGETVAAMVMVGGSDIDREAAVQSVVMPRDLGTNERSRSLVIANAFFCLNHEN